MGEVTVRLKLRANNTVKLQMIFTLISWHNQVLTCLPSTQCVFTCALK